MVWLLRHRPQILGWLALLSAGTVLLYGVLVLMPLRLAELGIRSPLTVAAVTVAMSVAMSLTGLAYATTVARLGHRRLLGMTYLAWAAAFAVLATTDHLALIMSAEAVFGAGMGLAVPALTVLLARASPRTLRGRVMAWSATAIFAGQFLSPLLLGPLADAVSVTAGFTAAAGLAVVVLLALLTTRLHRRERTPTPAFRPTGDHR